MCSVVMLRYFRFYNRIYNHRYLASGGYDSIVNMFDLSDWICVRTITSCE